MDRYYRYYSLSYLIINNKADIKYTNITSYSNNICYAINIYKFNVYL
jgi:hypothetical protein